MGVGKKIAIVGAGFSGTAVAAMLSRITTQPLEITLFDKSGVFGAGEAYRTPYPWHILNVRARDMSAFEDQPTHFVEWVSARQQHYPEIDTVQVIADQFLPRYLYHHYLRDILQQLVANTNQQATVELQTAEIIDAEKTTSGIKLTTKDKQAWHVDQVVLALGNHLPMQFPFPIKDMQTIVNPWDYETIQQIPHDANVMIVGMGLTMIDVVLTLQQQKHRGKIYTISRHGMLPQSHADSHVPYQAEENIKTNLRELTKQLRQSSLRHTQQGGDWRAIINALRPHIPTIWESASMADKKRFMRHVLPYWNIHRHRVHSRLTTILDELAKNGQLHTMAARVLRAEHGHVYVRPRYSNQEQVISADWLINCMGPGLNAQQTTSHLMQALAQRGSVALDPLVLGFAATTSGAICDASGQPSNSFFTLGPPAKGAVWECTAVPEIRRQSYILAKKLAGD